MRILPLCLAIAAVALAGAANARGLLDPYPTVGDIVFDPVTTTGDAKTLAKRGETCMAQTLKSGRADIPVIISSDPEGGRVVARSMFSFQPRYLARSTVVFEAKDGRFRISYTQNEMLDTVIGKWVAAFRRPDKGDDFTRIATDISNTVSACVTEAKSDW